MFNLNFLKKSLRNNLRFRSIFDPLLKMRQRSFREFIDAYGSAVEGGELLLRVENFKSSFYVEARSHLALRTVYGKQYESELIPLLKKVWKGGSIVNVGANVGFWSIGCCRVLNDVKQVIAIEPHPVAYQYLLRNIQHNSLEDRVYPIQTLISSEDEVVEFEFIPGMPEYSSIGEIAHASVANLKREKISLSSQRLDSIESVHMHECGLMLIDVEGAEYSVLQGSIRFVEKNRPCVLFECSAKLLGKFNHSVQNISRFFDDLNYVVIDVETKLSNLDESFDGEALAIPREKYSDFLS
jgi:FkbM family methyltransferase